MKATITTSLFLAACTLAAAGASAADAPAGAVEPVKVRAVTHFGFDRTTLAPADQARILAGVGKMKDVTWQSITATGHTDSLGKPAYNEKLSGERADAIKTYLVGKGLDPAMINTAGKGSSVPVASNASAAGRAKNRRTEIEFQGVRAK